VLSHADGDGSESESGDEGDAVETSVYASDYGRSIVRILVHDELTGTGFLVRPTVIVTAAHVIGASTAPSAVRVQSRSGEELDVEAVRVNQEWASSQRSDRDIALVLISSVEGAGLPILWNFAAAGGSYEVARYGYPAAGTGAYGVGRIHRGGNRFFTGDSALQIPAGESGCPLLYESGGVFATGIGTARSNPGDPNAFIGIPMLHSTVPALG
jgi:hypothetical protein